MAELDPATPDRMLGLLSVVVPMYNEEGTAEELYSRLVSALDGVRFELVVVDDCSTDATALILNRLADNDPRVRVIFLSRNFGHQAALTAGLEHARGDAVAMLDGDLQDPPEVLVEMLERWREGYEVVYAQRTRREGETRLKLTTARWFYRLFARVARLDLARNAGDFRLLDRTALDALLSLHERNRFIRGMTVWIGFRQIAVPHDRDPRFAGETKYTWRKMVHFALDAISSFSWVPLQAATVLGFVFSIVAFLAMPLVIIARYTGHPVAAGTTVLLVLLPPGGLQLIPRGMVGADVG